MVPKLVRKLEAKSGKVLNVAMYEDIDDGTASFFPTPSHESAALIKEITMDAPWNRYEITHTFPWDQANETQEERVEQLKGIIGRMGAKSKLRDWLIPRFPKHHTYVEPFGGSFKILMWKKRRSKIEIINDIDDDLIHFFRYVVFFPEILADLINSMPMHKKLVEYLREDLKSDSLTGLERAAAIYYSLKLSFNGTGSSYAGSATVLCSARANKAEFLRVSRRLERVDIRSGNAHNLISACNRRLDPVRYPGGVFFYLDPPYDETHGYSTVKGESTYGKKEQQELFMLAKSIHENGNTFIMTNSYTDWLRERWCSVKDWHYVKRDVYYSVSGDADSRKQSGELIVSNRPLIKKDNEIQRGLFK